MDALQHVVTPERLARIESVARARTDNVALVLDAVHDPHNVSACLRSADAFGVQNIFAVKEASDFIASSGVTKGSDRWLDVHLFDDPIQCVNELRQRDYRIFAAVMNADVELDELALRARSSSTKTAIVFGNEHRGVSEEMLANVDGTFGIPMHGFVESLNISVAAAIS
ncbi:MAG: RNA methyltransferase, partial [Polyangiales bacterium]